jgi:hypothetical protein
VEIRVNSGCDEITYPPAIYTVLAGTTAAIDPNEFSYVRVTLKRQPQGTYEVYSVQPEHGHTQTMATLA